MNVRLLIIAATWAMVVGAGMATLAVYSNRASEHPSPTRQIAPDAEGRARLILFLHPHCPCSAATMREFARLLTRADERTARVIYFYRPAESEPAWSAGPLRSSAEALPSVALADDCAGRIAEEFGARVSGEVRFYDAAGVLRFHGGITAARGHEGDNRGASAVAALLRGEPGDVDFSPTFGCSLHADR